MKIKVKFKLIGLRFSKFAQRFFRKKKRTRSHGEGQRQCVYVKLKEIKSGYDEETATMASYAIYGPDGKSFAAVLPTRMEKYLFFNWTKGKIQEEKP
jgi:hypothetical protein